LYAKLINGYKHSEQYIVTNGLICYMKIQASKSRSDSKDFIPNLLARDSAPGPTGRQSRNSPARAR